MKYALTININDIYANDNVKVVDDITRGDLSAKLELNHGMEGVSLDCRRVYIGQQALRYETFSEVEARRVAEYCDDLSIPYLFANIEGDMLRVSILDLLDTGWMLVQPRQRVHKTEVVCTAPTPNILGRSPVFTLGFVNDGTNLWAEFDGTTDKQALDVLKVVLGKTNTKYEVL
jgi:hypothetical protein